MIFQSPAVKKYLIKKIYHFSTTTTKKALGINLIKYMHDLYKANYKFYGKTLKKAYLIEERKLTNG